MTHIDDLDEFEIWNRWGGNPPKNPNPFGSTGGWQKRRVPKNSREQFGEDLAWAAIKVLPADRIGPHLKYRMAVVRFYLELEGESQNDKDVESSRPGPLGRLDCAFTKVAKANDMDVSTIRNACTRAYEGDSPTRDFRADCIQIVESLSNND